MMKGFVKHFRINISDIKIERRFDDSVSLLSSSKYMIELDNDDVESSNRKYIASFYE